MDAVIDSFRRDHRKINALLRVLECECDLFRRAERPDYELLSEIIDYFRSSLDQYYYLKEDLMFNLTRVRTTQCDSIIDNIADERAVAASSLQVLGDTLRDILNEQRVLRQTFNDAAHAFIQHERRQIEIEERQLFPAVLSILAPADWADLRTKLSNKKEPLRSHGLEERLRESTQSTTQKAETQERVQRSRDGDKAPVNLRP